MTEHVLRERQLLAYNVEEVQDDQFMNVSVLHRESSGVICLCQQGEATNGEWKNFYGRYKNVLNHLEEMEDLRDLFISQNTFKKCRRSVNNLLELNALYLDIDGYKLTPKVSKSQIIARIDDYVREGLIPQPTLIIDSGHGINVIWKIKRVPAQALPLWQAMADYLMECFKELKPDACSKDCSRIFRVIGSVNNKLQKKEIVQLISYVPIEYDLHDLQKEFIPISDRPRPKGQSQQKSKGSGTQNVRKLLTKLSLHYNRLLDILQLCEMRNYDMIGYREHTLFLIRYYSYCFHQDAQTAMEDMLEINRKFTKVNPTCTESKVLRLTQSAEKAAAESKYNYRTSTLIKMFDITEEEQRKLRTLISKEEKARRKKHSNRESRRNKDGVTHGKARINKRKQETIELREQGMTQGEIAKKLGVSKRTVQNYLKE